MKNVSEPTTQKRNSARPIRGLLDASAAARIFFSLLMFPLLNIVSFYFPGQERTWPTDHPCLRPTAHPSMGPHANTYAGHLYARVNFDHRKGNKSPIQSRCPVGDLNQFHVSKGRQVSGRWAAVRARFLIPLYP